MFHLAALGSKDRFNPERLIIAFGVINTIWEVKRRRGEGLLSRWCLTSLCALGLRYAGYTCILQAEHCTGFHELWKNSPQDTQGKQYPTLQCCYRQLKYFSGVLHQNTSSLAHYKNVTSLSLPPPETSCHTETSSGQGTLETSHMLSRTSPSGPGDTGTSNNHQGKAGSDLT